LWRLPEGKSGTRYTPIDRGAQEDEVRAQHLLDYGQWNGRRLVDDQQLCLPQLRVVLCLNVLDSLQSTTIVTYGTISEALGNNQPHQRSQPVNHP
jgi:hypothetical protein